jgi:hypothetical protein
MTPDELEAIRAQDAEWTRRSLSGEDILASEDWGDMDVYRLVGDRHDLLAEVDRLTALNFAHNDEEHDCGTNAERARILVRMEGLKYEYRGRTGKVKMWVEAAAVIAVIKKVTK